jgi:hypothetical protein
VRARLGASGEAGSFCIDSGDRALAMRFTLFLLFLVVLILAGGAVFLLTWDIPAPTASVEKVIPNDRFPR